MESGEVELLRRGGGGEEEEKEETEEKELGHGKGKDCDLEAYGASFEEIW